MVVGVATSELRTGGGFLITSFIFLRLPYIREHYEALAKEAAEHGWSHIESLERLIEGEAHLREDRRVQRHIRLARFPVIKTLEQFQWSWPKKINRLQAQNLFRLAFIEEKANAIFLHNFTPPLTPWAVLLSAQCVTVPNLYRTARSIIN